MFLLNLTYVKPLEEIDRLLPEHVRYLDTWYERGMFLCSGRKEPRTGGIILCKCKSREEAESIRNQDPFYREGAASYELMEFRPTKAAKELQVLLE